MPEQQRGDALFFAVIPDPDAAAQIADIAKQLRWEYQLSSEPIEIERLHVSLNPIGKFDILPDDIVAAAKSAGDAVRVKPFDITLDRHMSFVGDSHPLVLSCGKDSAHDTLALYDGLNTALKAVGLPVRKHPPQLHMTLFYEFERLPTAVLETPITWRVEEFVLLWSQQGSHRHIHLARWPLR